MSESIIQAKNISKLFESKGKSGPLRAVDNVSLEIGRGENIGLVGESGCGKTTLGRILLGLIKPSSGEIFFDGNLLDPKQKNKLKEFRRRTSVVFQDPYSSLDPHMIVLDIVAEPLDIQKSVQGEERERRAGSVLQKLGLSVHHMYRYPHEFSGGQRQRIAIARAIVNDPEFIVLDEPTSALDVSVQAQILNYLNAIRSEREVAFLLISHDLGVVRQLTKRTAVMYLGNIVEIGDTEEIFENPLHPYTQALLASIPSPDPKIGLPEAAISGDVPSPFDIPKGCRFSNRCPRVMERCKVVEPKLEYKSNSHAVACYLYE